MTSPSKFRGKAEAYALLARNAYSDGERELMRRLELSCLALARDEERGIAEINTDRNQY